MNASNPNFYSSSVTPRFVLECVHVDFVREAVVWLYNNSLDFELDHPERISQFLTTDLYHLGLKAEEYHLQKLTVNIDHVHYGLIISATTGKAFQTLLHTNLGPGFELVVEVIQPKGKSIDAIACFNLGVALESTIKQLKAKGHKVTVTCEDFVLQKIDISEMMGATGIEWQDFWSKQIAVCFIIRPY